jgi:hypothetical protein
LTAWQQLVSLQPANDLPGIHRTVRERWVDDEGGRNKLRAPSFDDVGAELILALLILMTLMEDFDLSRMHLRL